MDLQFYKDKKVLVTGHTGFKGSWLCRILINAGAEVTLPCYYQVGQEVLDVYLDTERLALSSDDAGTDGHYREIGDADSISNKIKTTTDWQLETGDILTLVVRGEYNANT